MLAVLLWIVLVPTAGAAVTFLSGRLLGARRGWLSLFAGVIGWAGAIVVAGVLTDWDWTSAGTVAASLLLGTVLTMTLAVGFDLFAPLGSLASESSAGLVTVTNPVTGIRRKAAPF